MKFFILLALISCTFANPISEEEDDTNAKIVGGTIATAGQMPYYAMIRKQGRMYCGGSILDATTILTAAHCIEGTIPRDLTIHVGTIRTAVAGVTHRVVSMFSHPRYNGRALLDDIAVIKLSSSIAFNSNVRPIAMRTSNTVDTRSYYASGLGNIGNGLSSNELRWVALTPISLETCRSRLAVVRIPVNAGNLCTSSPAGKGTCNGDSGGPLVDSDGRLVGVVSKGEPCALGYPDVFASVPYYRNWISNLM